MTAATFHELYEGQITIWFDEDRHRYFLDGRRVPGVTRILERGREPFDDERIREAADIGTTVHDFAEQCLKGLKPALPTDPQAQSAARALLRWLNAHDVTPLHCERVCYSRRFCF